MQHLTILSAQHDKIQVEIAHTEEMTSDSDIIVNLKDSDQSHDTHHPQIIVVGSTQETQARSCIPVVLDVFYLQDASLCAEGEDQVDVDGQISIGGVLAWVEALSQLEFAEQE